MPRSSRSLLPYIATVTPNGAFRPFMPSGFSRRMGRNHWPRGYWPPPGVYGGFSEIDAFASNDLSDVRGANYGASCEAWGSQQQQQQQQFWHWRPWHPGVQPQFWHRGPLHPGVQPQIWHQWSPQPGFPPKSDDHRNWIGAASQPPREWERFKILSYNILADYLALDHHSTLYLHIPKYILDWEWRKRRLLIEFGLWSPDIMCLQEVDRFYDLEVELAIRGYAGIWKMRTGNAVDGCAIFWRTNRFQLLYEEHIEFNKFGLRDNVAQICVLESIMQNDARNPAEASPMSYNQLGANQVIVCNIHVLYNPKRGEIKLGQVRVLLDRAFAVSKVWNNAPVIVCGDFNSTPNSPLYNFIATQKLNLSGLTRDRISGQYSSTLHIRPNYGVSSYSGDESRSSFDTPQHFCKSRPEYQNNVGNPSPFENSTAVIYPYTQLKADRQMPINATSIKSGETEIFSHHGGEVRSSHLELGNISNRNYEVFSQQSTVHVSKEADKNGEEAQSLCVDGNSFSFQVQNDHSASETAIGIAGSEQNILDKPCFEDHKVFPGMCNLAGGIKLNSVSCIDNLTASSLPSKINYNGFREDDNYIGNAPSFHSSTGDFSTMSLPSDANAVCKILYFDVADNDLSKEKPSTSSTSFEIPRIENVENFSPGSDVAEKSDHLITCLNSGQGDELNLFKFDGSNVSERMVAVSSIEYKEAIENIDSGVESNNFSCDNISGVSAHFRDLSSDTVSAENGRSPEPLELSGLEDNIDLNFLKELHGIEDGNQLMKDSDTSNVELIENSPFLISIDASNEESYLYNPYSWSSMETEIATGRANCTVVEHPLKLRSVYTDVEDCTRTKDSSREPLITSYNLQFMGTVDYIWCSEDLLTAMVLDTIPKHIMQRTRGFPTKKWGSDHISLACELAFSRGSRKA